MAEDRLFSVQDTTVLLAGIKQFGLAPDGSDLRDLTVAIEAALAAERERCARIADGFACGLCGMDGKAAAAIRASEAIANRRT